VHRCVVARLSRRGLCSAVALALRLTCIGLVVTASTTPLTDTVDMADASATAAAHELDVRHGVRHRSKRDVHGCRWSDSNCSSGTEGVTGRSETPPCVEPQVCAHQRVPVRPIIGPRRPVVAWGEMW